MLKALPDVTPEVTPENYRDRGSASWRAIRDDMALATARAASASSLTSHSGSIDIHRVRKALDDARSSRDALDRAIGSLAELDGLYAQLVADRK